MDGFSFAGWNTQPDGLGTHYSSGQSFVMTGSNLELYAWWTQKPTYNVIYRGNENDNGNVPLDENNYEQNMVAHIAGNTGALKREGFTFIGWNTDPDGKGKSYRSGDTLIIKNTDATLYAVWTIEKTHTITYMGNGNKAGNVPVDNNSYRKSDTVIIKGNTGLLQRPGTTFSGWSLDTIGNGVLYSAGSVMIMDTANIVLYAN
jgi:hypothetical protein